LIPLQGKVELLRESIGEVQKYELLTTNQYLKQMELLVEILEDVSVRAESRTGIIKIRARARQNAGEYTGKMKEPLRSVNRRTPIIMLNTSGGILMGWLGLSLLLKEVSVISGHNWWPVFSAGIGVLLILRGVMIYEKTKYWSNDKAAFIGGAFFILLSLLGFVNFGALTSYWSILVVIIGISITRI